MIRGALLAASQSSWLRRRATRSRMVRRAVSRFMPGETLDDALAAATALGAQGLGTILTCLGENISERSEAETVTRHYFECLDRIRAQKLDAEVSVKLTQLGLDLDPTLAVDNLERIARHAHDLGNRLWVDMESSEYTDRTLEIYRTLKPRHANMGVAVQSYLRRTTADVEALIPMGGIIRVVKGAYQESPSIAFPGKRDVDEQFYTLSVRLLAADARRAGARLIAGTHDPVLIERIQRHAESTGVPRSEFEFAMLYGIRTAAQVKLAHEGYPTRALISYGSYWFPWYMRRLAERPANLLFVMKSVFGG